MTFFDMSDDSSNGTGIRIAGSTVSDMHGLLQEKEMLCWEKLFEEDSP